MKKVVVSLISMILAVSIFALPAFAAGGSGTDSLACPKCGSSLNVSAVESGLYLKYSYVCSNSSCDYKREEQKYFWGDSIKGSSSEPVLTKFVPGGGTSEGGGVGRRPDGYSDNNVPSISSSGQLHLFAPVIGWSATPNYEFTPSAYTSDPAPFYTSASFTGSCFRKSYTGSRRPYIVIGFTAPVSGTYTIKAGSCAGSYTYLSGNSHSWETSYGKVNQDYSFAAAAGKKYYIDIYVGGYDACDFECVGTGLDVYCTPLTTTVKQQNNITINNNTWNGNIYQDNSTNLTYIYPQYTTINENNETVTNISNNPIIYNNTTNQYYTYDNTTNNYYYITYNTTPSPTPDPGTDRPSTPESGETGNVDLTGISALLVQIRDNVVQGFANIQAALVQGWADLSANFTLAIDNLNINIKNFFDKKFPDEPEPTPSPTPDPSTAIPSVNPGVQHQFIIPKMTDDTYTDGYGTWVATVFKLWDSTDKAMYAFDRDLETLFSTGLDENKNPTMPCYVQIEIPSNKQFYIDGYTIVPGKSPPTTWKLQGSDDGENWETVDSQSNQSLDTEKSYYDYSVPLHKAYKYYRLFMTEYQSGKVRCNLYEFNLYGYSKDDVTVTYPSPSPSPSPSPDPGTDPTPTPGGGGGGSGGGGGDGGGGSSWNPLKWLTDLLKDIVEGILKAIWKLICTIFGFILWLLSLLAKLLPFLPSEAAAALVAGAVIVTVIRIIKFIIGR